jgi:predicted ATPase
MEKVNKMWVSKINLENIKSFSSSGLQLSEKINVIVGPNNAGKSIILDSVLTLQYPGKISTYLRMGESSGKVTLTLQGKTKKYINLQGPVDFTFDLAGNKRTLIHSSGRGETGFTQIPAVEPGNYIYPFLSKRKVGSFKQGVDRRSTNAVLENFQNLYAKIDRTSNPQFPAYGDYIKACDDILGFRVSTISSEEGKKAALIINTFDYIPLDAMGEGVVDLLGLIVDLCVAENKLFIIEEPENDIHPKALKSLLELIVEKSQNNQFIIATHSNIVTKYLGAQSESKIFNIKMTFIEKIPTSTIEEVGESSQERLKIMEQLGYEFFDFDLWNGWLFLEESSAEKIIRDYLISMFVPELKKKLRTYSAGSINEVEPKFKDFNNLFVFLHLEPSYKDRAWIIVDGGREEEEIINRIKQIYTDSGWKEDRFLQFKEHDFEKYYPKQFQEKVEEVLGMSDKSEKRARKKVLLGELESWIHENEERAKAAFESSASEVIEILRSINSSLSE